MRNLGSLLAVETRLPEATEVPRVRTGLLNPFPCTQGFR
jgi:hypothetical protein